MDNCLFCKIANHEIPSYVVYEDDKVLAFLDIAQATSGYTLVIPKKHSDDITSIEDSDLDHAMHIAKKIAKHMLEVLPNCKGVNILNNCKAEAGQTIMHTHIHIIPRYDSNDGIKFEFKDNSSKCTPESMKAIANKLHL